MQKLLSEVSKHFNNIDQYSKISDALTFVSDIKCEHDVYNFNFTLRLVEDLLKVMPECEIVLSAIYYFTIKNELLTLEAVAEQAGKTVVDILSTLQKIEALKINTKESQEQNIKNMFIALAKDIRTVILKLAIEQQKILVIDKFTKDQQKIILAEVGDIYSPISSTIGISYFKNTFENELFKITKPIDYANLNRELHKYVEDRNKQIQLSLERIKNEILPIKAVVYGRQKQISSIYKKIEGGKRDISQVYDILAVRVIVDSVEDCYNVLGKIHAIYQPLERFKDYIAQPKKNGYQSLHTTVVVENNDPLEIQIRTHEMHDYAEYGFAAHWAYKQNRNVNESDKRISYIRSIMEMHKEMSSEELLDSLKIDVYSGHIFCQTPMGKVLQFPEGATPIDFAYAIHSNVGNACVGAKVNGKMVPLTTQLKNGDIVEIITNSNSKGPSRDWLKIIKTSEARSKINTFFKKEMKEENVKKGRSMLESQAKSRGYSLSKLLKDEFLQEIYDKYTLNNLNDLYAMIGYGSVSAYSILTRLVNELRAEEKRNAPEIVEETSSKKIVQTNTKNDVVSVRGYPNLMVKLGKCCSPLPGDDIIGYVSRGKGVTVHRQSCSTLYNTETERLIECEWVSSSGNKFIGQITIVVLNTVNALATISKKIADLRLNVASITTSKKTADNTTILLGVEVENYTQLNDLITKLNHLNVVMDIYRSS